MIEKVIDSKIAYAKSREMRIWQLVRITYTKFYKRHLVSVWLLPPRENDLKLMELPVRE